MGKGGGGGGQTTSTSYQTNIPQYAQPYVENMLGATQKQLFNTREVPAVPGSQTQSGTDENGNPIYNITEATPGYTELTGFKQYQPYSTNPSDYVAGFSPLQQQGFSSLADMQVAPQLAMGTNLANRSSEGALSTAAPAMGYGAQGVGIGQQGLGIGQIGMGAGMAYGQNATNPNAVSAYMNPYIENTLRPSLDLMNQQYGMQGAAEQGAATSAGAFGGSRQALMQGLNQQNRMLAGNQLVGNAYNNAYNVANQNMQAASQLGMQGAGVGLQGVGAGLQGVNTGLQGIQGAQNAYGLGLQGANTLNTLGNSLYNQQMGIAQAQLGAGAQQQGQQQQIINQGVQDYANAQQYPLMQLGTMSNMLRGLPMQAATTNQYLAAPNPVTQGIGAAGSLAYMNSAMNRPYAKGGIIQAFDVGGEVEADLKNMSVQQLQQYMKESASPQAKRIAQSIMRERMIEEQLQKQQPQMQQFARGGITDVQRFQNRGEVELVPGRGTGRVNRDTPESDVVAQFNELERRGRSAAPSPAPVPTAAPASNSARVTTPNTLYGLSGVGGTGLSPRTSVTPTIDAETGEVVNAPREPGSGVRIPSYMTPEINPPTLATVSVTADEEKDSAPASSGIMQAGVSASDKQLLGEPPRQYRDRDEAMAELLAEKEKYGLTTNKGAEEFRTRAMSERANLKDEADRQRNMRMAEFFASWGSTPGNTIVAGMVALKNKIPDMIADDREQAKARKEADKIIFEIDQAIRAEKLGDFAEAGKIKEKAADRAEKFNEKLLMLQMTRETNASRVAAAGAGALNKQEQLALQQSRINDNAYNSAMRDYKGAKDAIERSAEKNADYNSAIYVLNRLPNTPDNKQKIEDAKKIIETFRQQATTTLKPYVNSIIRAGAAKEVEHNPDEFLYPFGRPSNVASNNGFRIVSQE